MHEFIFNCNTKTYKNLNLLNICFGNATRQNGSAEYNIGTHSKDSELSRSRLKIYTPCVTPMNSLHLFIMWLSLFSYFLSCSAFIFRFWLSTNPSYQQQWGQHLLWEKWKMLAWWPCKYVLQIMYLINQPYISSQLRAVLHWNVLI